MYPTVVQGQMPFVDQKARRNEQIKKVIQKHRARHNSGPEKFNTEKHQLKNKNTVSMPSLGRSLCTTPRPRYNSMPSLDKQAVNIPIEASKNGDKKMSIVKAIKSLFSKKETKDASGYKTRYQPKSGAIVEKTRCRAYSAPMDITSSRVDVNGAAVSPPGRSPKRQRTRTVSNISSVMETIQEINEIPAYEYESDSSSPLSSAAHSDIYYPTSSVGSKESIVSLHSTSSSGVISCGA